MNNKMVLEVNVDDLNMGGVYGLVKNVITNNFDILVELLGVYIKPWNSILISQYDQLFSNLSH